MNTVERAIEVIEDEHDPNFGPIDAPTLVYALNGDGLLRPNPPKLRDMGSGIAELPRGVQVRDRRTVHVYLADDYGQGKATLTSQEARAYGEELIAAADYIEQEQADV